MSKSNFGVITEQGFVAGNGLGYEPVSEEDLNIKNEEEENESNTSK